MARLLKTRQQSFGAGIIGDELYGRLDQAKYQVGLAQCDNFMVLPHGPVANRAGFEFIKATNNSSAASRLIPFIFNSEQAYALEFGDQTLRVHTEGASVLEAQKTVATMSSANPINVQVNSHGYSDNDEVYFSGFSISDDFSALEGRYFRINYVDANNFTIDVDGSGFSAFASGAAKAARVYTETSPYSAADLFDIQYVQSADTLTLVHPDYAPRELVRTGAANWTFSTISFGPSLSPPTGVTATATVGTGSTTYRYLVTSVDSTGLEESVKSTANACTNDLTTAGNYNTVSWSGAAGASRYNVYKQRNGLYGYIGQTDNLSFIDDNIEPDMLTQPPINKNPFSGVGNYPGAVTYFEQRRVFGGTDNDPQTVWMTRSGTESNLTYSIPARDSDSIEFTLASRQLNRVRHLVPLADLLLMTNAGEWKVTAQNSDAITPTTVWVRPQGYTGAAGIAPIIARDAIVFPQSQGGHFADMAFDNDQQLYKTRDISVLAPHLFDGYTFTDWCYTRAPHPMIWAVRSDGKLLGLTYLPDQEVLAYHLHETAGTFESVVAIPEGGEDAVYAIVNRTLSGATLRYIERLHSRAFTTIQDAFFVDSGLTYDGAATTTVTGLDHLEGESVTVLADGSVHPNKTVTDGGITLDYEASKVHIGLGYSATLKTLPLIFNFEDYGQSAVKRATHAYLRVHETRGIAAGPDTSTLTEYKERTTEAYGDPTQPISDILEIPLSTSWARDPRLVVQQANPLPTTVLSLALKVAVNA